MTTLSIARDERVHLAGLLGRLLRWNDATIVRLITTERAVGVYADAPMGVLVFVALPLAQAPAEPLDRAVSAHRLRDALGDVASPLTAAGPLAVGIPDARDMPPALAAIPSRDGWIAAERATAAEVAAAVDAALAEFHRQGEAIAGATEAAKANLAAEWWSKPAWGGLPLKALHAAHSLGMLAHPGARIESATRAGWKRMQSPAGQVFVAPPESYSGIALSVVR
ncbi:MAG: hypothetical protein QG597_1757 [Actinomycetota bacterium]|nr:hypothetical protein [Actinomycetota bacterium]